MSTQLRTGWNLVVYKGTVQPASTAFASILSIVTGSILYIDNLADLNVNVLTDTPMVPYGVYWIETTQDIVWTYGAIASAPFNVQLYVKPHPTSPDTYFNNIVAYSGPVQLAEAALRSIAGVQIGTTYIWNSTIQDWVIIYSGTPMLEDTPYVVTVTQDVLWVFVTAPPSTFSGIISQKELEYNSSRADIPASDIPLGEDGLVHIWGRNDTDSAQQMGISWIIIDPDNVTVENYSTWESWPYTGANGDHEFIGGRFDMSKVGMYHISVNLLMNHDSPEVVDTYTGILCIITPTLAFANLAVSTFSRE